MAAKYDHNNAAQMQELEDSTSCGICLEIFKCPKLLPCGHTFCMNCIQETGLKTNKGPGDEMPCPICRQQFKIPSEGFIGLQNNYYIESLIRVAQILDPTVAALTACDACLEENREEAGKEVPRTDMYCTDCKQKLCEECCRHHRKLKLTKNHKLISMNGQRPTDEDLIQSLSTSVCELHKQEDLKIYCCICKTVVCAICFTEHHEGHKGSQVTKAADDLRKEITNNFEKVRTFVGQVEMKKSEIIKAKQDAHEKFGSLECDIISRRDGLRQLVDKHANSLLEELCTTKLSILKEIHIETDDIDAQLTRLESYNSYCKKIMTKASACDICRSAGDLSVRVNELQEENQSLIEQKLKPVTLCFVQTEFEEEDGGNMIGQLKDCIKGEEKIPEDQIEVGNHSADRTRNNENLEVQEHNEDGDSNLKIGADWHSTSQILKAVKEKNYIRSKILNEKKMVEMKKKSHFVKAKKFRGAGQEASDVPELLAGWERRLDGAGRYYYVDHKMKKTSWDPPGTVQQKLGCLKIEENRQRNLIEKNAKYQESTKSSGLQENQSTDREFDRICALMLLPSVDIDEDVFYFLKRQRSQELYRISDKCNLYEPYKVGQQHKLAFEAKPQYDTDSVIADFRALYYQTTITRVSIPGGVDTEILKSLVGAMAEFKDVELRFLSQERVCKIVGSYREINRARDMLTDVIDSNEPTSHGFDTTANYKTSKARMSVYTVLNQDNDSVLLSVSKSLTINVKHGDMTTMSNTDVVVSCINHQLNIDGALADQIMRAAGPNVKTELLSHKHRLSFLPTGDMVHTSAGNLKGVKAIIHVVRPQGSMDDLRNVFINCFSYTNDELRLKSICLPPIRFHVYDAQMIVDCFLDAVEMFVSTVVNGNPSAAAQHHSNLHHLNYIQLVTNDHHCIEQLLHRVRQT